MKSTAARPSKGRFNITRTPETANANSIGTTYQTNGESVWPVADAGPVDGINVKPGRFGNPCATPVNQRSRTTTPLSDCTAPSIGSKTCLRTGKFCAIAPSRQSCDFNDESLALNDWFSVLKTSMT